MPDSFSSASSDEQRAETSSAARLLRGAAVLTAVVGGGIAVWLADKAVRYPEVRAAQFEASAPLWVPFLLFVLACTGLMAYVFVRAARRVESGEDLFARRHRRRPSSGKDVSEDALEDAPEDAPGGAPRQEAAPNGTAS